MGLWLTLGAGEGAGRGFRRSSDAAAASRFRVGPGLGGYDYVHFPPDERSRARRNFAFVNFATPEQCARCADSIAGTQLPGATNKEVIVAEVAKQQGVEANLAVLPGTRRRYASHADFLPWVRTREASELVPCHLYVW